MNTVLPYEIELKYKEGKCEEDLKDFIWDVIWQASLVMTDGVAYLNGHYKSNSDLLEVLSNLFEHPSAEWHNIVCGHLHIDLQTIPNAKFYAVIWAGMVSIHLSPGDNAPMDDHCGIDTLKEIISRLGLYVDYSNVRASHEKYSKAVERLLPIWD